jgi:hypothetical protein
MPHEMTSPATEAAVAGRSDAIVSIEEILDRGETDTLQIRRAPGANALQILKWRIECDHFIADC